MAEQRPSSSSGFRELREALERLERRQRKQWERARRAIYLEAVAHFDDRAKRNPDLRLSPEAVSAILRHLLIDFWGRGASHYEEAEDAPDFTVD